MKRLFSILISIFTLVACDLLTSNDYVEVSPTHELHFESGADSSILVINSSGKWVVGEVPAWITIAPTEGEDTLSMVMAPIGTTIYRTSYMEVILAT